jgi:2-C-methyl-D-erythritol 4-phosphate cytidylyltransferase
MNIGLIVAAGRGYRLGGPVPKQYLLLAGQPILRHTILALLDHPEIHAVQVMIHPDDRSLYAAATEGLDLRPVLFGGATRQDSVRLGLEGIADLNPVNVLIHDAVRPFVAPETISAVLAALARFPCAIAGVPLADTLKRCAEGRVTGTVDRAGLYRAQTPQGFRYADILKAHRQVLLENTAGLELTDDSMVAEHAGLAVEMVAGSEQNFKITTAQDLQRAEFLLKHGSATF